MNADPRPPRPDAPEPAIDAPPRRVAPSEHEQQLLWMMQHPPAPLAPRVAAGAPRLVLDTNVSLDLIVFADPRWDELRRCIAEGLCDTVMDIACRVEFARVLSYPQFALQPTQRVEAMQAFDAMHRMLPEQEGDGAIVQDLPQCRDTDDQKFMELALRAGADALLSKDKALLKLARKNRRKGLFEILSPQVWLERQVADAPES